MRPPFFGTDWQVQYLSLDGIASEWYDTGGAFMDADGLKLAVRPYGRRAGLYGVNVMLYSHAFYQQYPNGGGSVIRAHRTVPVYEVWPPVLIGGRKQDVYVRGWFLKDGGGYLDDGATAQMTVGGIPCSDVKVLSDDPFNSTCVKAVKGTLDLTEQEVTGDPVETILTYNPVVTLRNNAVLKYGPEYLAEPDRWKAKQAYVATGGILKVLWKVEKGTLPDGTEFRFSTNDTAIQISSEPTFTSVIPWNAPKLAITSSAGDFYVKGGSTAEKTVTVSVWVDNKPVSADGLVITVAKVVLENTYEWVGGISVRGPYKHFCFGGNPQSDRYSKIGVVIQGKVKPAGIPRDICQSALRPAIQLSVEPVGISKRTWLGADPTTLSSDTSPAGSDTVLIDFTKSGDDRYGYDSKSGELRVMVKYDGLPDLNSDFGKKTARIHGTEDTPLEFFVFFPYEANNHPTLDVPDPFKANASAAPNWYYYWSATKKGTKASVCSWDFTATNPKVEWAAASPTPNTYPYGEYFPDSQKINLYNYGLYRVGGVHVHGTFTGHGKTLTVDYDKSYADLMEHTYWHELRHYHQYTLSDMKYWNGDTSDTDQDKLYDAWETHNNFSNAFAVTFKDVVYPISGGTDTEVDADIHGGLGRSEIRSANPTNNGPDATIDNGGSHVANQTENWAHSSTQPSVFNAKWPKDKPR